MDLEFSENQFDEQMIIRPLSAEQIAINEKKLSMTLNDIIQISRKTASCNPRACLNKRKNVSTAGGNFSNVWSRRESKPSKKKNYRQKFPTAGAPLGNSTSVWSRLKVSKPSVRQGLASQRYLNLQSNQFHLVRAVATNMAPAPTRTRPLIRNKMPNLSNSRVGVTPIQKRSVPEKKQGYSAQEFDSFYAYVNAKKKVVPHFYEY